MSVKKQKNIVIVIGTLEQCFCILVSEKGTHYPPDPPTVAL